MWTETFATLVDRKLLGPSSRTAYVAVQRDFLVALLAPALSAIHLGAATSRWPIAEDRTGLAVLRCR